MTEIVLLVNDRTHKPYRVKVDGIILLDSKGEPKRFSLAVKQTTLNMRRNKPRTPTQAVKYWLSSP